MQKLTKKDIEDIENMPLMPECSDVDKQLLEVVQYAKENGYEEAANWIKATIPFKEMGITFRMSKQLNQKTGELQYRIDACYANAEGKGKNLPRQCVYVDASDCTSEQDAFNTCALHLAQSIFNESKNLS